MVQAIVLYVVSFFCFLFLFFCSRLALVLYVVCQCCNEVSFPKKKKLIDYHSPPKKRKRKSEKRERLLPVFSLLSSGSHHYAPFTECTQAILFWNEFLYWSSCVVNSRLLLLKNEIMFGVINKDSTSCLALNHLVIIGKHFLYVNALNSKFYVFNKFVFLVRDKIRLEKYISSTSSRVKEFEKNNGLVFLIFKHYLLTCTTCIIL